MKLYPPVALNFVSTLHIIPGLIQPYRAAVTVIDSGGSRAIEKDIVKATITKNSADVRPLSTKARGGSPPAEGFGH